MVGNVSGDLKVIRTVSKCFEAFQSAFEMFEMCESDSEAIEAIAILGVLHVTLLIASSRTESFLNHVI